MTRSNARGRAPHACRKWLDSKDKVGMVRAIPTTGARRMARRSPAVVPPHTPTRLASLLANWKQSKATGHRPQIALAASTRTSSSPGPKDTAGLPDRPHGSAIPAARGSPRASGILVADERVEQALVHARQARDRRQYRPPMYAPPGGRTWCPPNRSALNRSPQRRWRTGSLLSGGQARPTNPTIGTCWADVTYGSGDGSRAAQQFKPGTWVVRF